MSNIYPLDNTKEDQPINWALMLIAALAALIVVVFSVVIVNWYNARQELHKLNVIKDACGTQIICIIPSDGRATLEDHMKLQSI